MIIFTRPSPRYLYCGFRTSCNASVQTVVRSSQSDCWHVHATFRGIFEFHMMASCEPRRSSAYSDDLRWRMVSLVPRLLFTERENSLVNCLYRFGSNILKSLWRHVNRIVYSKTLLKQQTLRQPTCAPFER